MNRSDVVFLAACGKVGLSDPPTPEQLERIYLERQASIMEAVADFSVDELNRMVEAAKAIRARRPESRDDD